MSEKSAMEAKDDRYFGGVFRGAFIDAVCSVGVWVGGSLLLAISAAVGTEVVLRKFFNLSIPGIDELAGYGMAISFAWAMPFAIISRAHIRVDIIYSQMPLRIRIALDILAALSFIAYLSVLNYFIIELFMDSYRENTLSGGVLLIPLYIPHGIWGIGFLVSVVVLVIGLVGALRTVGRVLRQNVGPEIRPDQGARG